MKYLCKTKLVILFLVATICISKNVYCAETAYKYKENSDGTITLTSYTGDDRNVVVPMYIDGKKVVRISKYVFYQDNYIKTVDIPETVNTIDSQAFYSCINLEKVNIYGDIDSFGDYVFYGCRDLTEVNFHGRVSRLGIKSFSYCESLEFFICPKGIKHIEDDCFYMSDYLETVVLNNEIETIQWQIWYSEGLVLLDIPDSVYDINMYENKNYLSVEKNMISLYCPISIMNNLNSTTNWGDIKYTNIERTPPIIDTNKLLYSSFGLYL